MPTLDDTPIDEEPGAEPAPEFGDQVHALLRAAATSSRVRTQSLGRRAHAALGDLRAAIEREGRIAAAEAELSRLRRGGA